MKEQRAAGIPMRVVSAKKPGHWIVRSIHCFATVEEVQGEVLDFVGRVDVDDLEWTTFEYHLPSYLVYPGGDLHALGSWPSGTYICRHLGSNTYGEPEAVRKVARSWREWFLDALVADYGGLETVNGTPFDRDDADQVLRAAART